MDIPGFPYGVNADVQDIVVAPSGTMYVTTDGGIYKSTDGGSSYTECNYNFNVTQFYGMAHSAGPAVIGGTQDNGTLLIPSSGFLLNDQGAVEVHGGDGFDLHLQGLNQLSTNTLGLVLRKTVVLLEEHLNHQLVHMQTLVISTITTLTCLLKMVI